MNITSPISKSGILKLLSIPFITWNTIFILVILGAGLLLSNTIIAQATLPMASVSQKGIVQLPTDRALSNQYTFDLSSYHFKSDDEMIEFLSNKSGDHFLFRALTNEKQGILILQNEDRKNWNVQKWNEHLAKETARIPLKK